MISGLTLKYINISCKDFLIAALIAFFSLFLLPYPILGICLIVVVLLIIKYGFKSVILLALIVMLTATGPSLEKFRAFISLLSIIAVVYIFLVKKGLIFNNYRKLPIDLIILISLIVFTIILTSINSGLHFGTIIILLKTTLFFTICYILYSILEWEEGIQLYNIALIVASIIVSITVYYDMINAGLTVYVVQGVLARYAGVYGNPNYVGLLLSLTTVILFVNLFSNKFKSASRKILIWIILLNNTLIILITNSRAAIIGTVIALFFILFHLNKKFLYRGVIGIISMIMILLSIPAIQDFFNAFIRLETVNERSIHWSAGWDIASENFLLGIGPEMFSSKIFSYVPSSAGLFFETDTTVFKLHPHNFFLLMIAENGILGLTFSLLIFYIFFKLSWRVIKITKNIDYENYILSLSYFSIGIILFIRAFFEVDGIFSYGFITRDLPFWIIFVLVSHLYNVYQNTINKDNFSITN